MKVLKPKYYFTNQLVNRHEAACIAQVIQEETLVELVNPFYEADGTPTPEISHLDEGMATTVENPTIVRMDLKKIIDTDGIVAYLTHKSFGSPCEIAMAHEMWGKPVYAIVPTDSELYIQHPWIQECTSKVFSSIQEFIEFAGEKWGYNDKISTKSSACTGFGNHRS